MGQPGFRPEPRRPETMPTEPPLDATVRVWANAIGPWLGAEYAKLIAFGHGALWIVSAEVIDSPGTRPWSWGEQRLWRVVDAVFEEVDLGDHWYGGPEVRGMFSSRRDGCMILLMRDGVFECDRSLTTRLISRDYALPCMESPNGDLYWAKWGEVMIVGPDRERRITVRTDDLGYAGFPRCEWDDRGEITHEPVESVAIVRHGQVWILGADPGPDTSSDAEPEAILVGSPGDDQAVVSEAPLLDNPSRMTATSQTVASGSCMGWCRGGRIR